MNVQVDSQGVAIIGGHIRGMGSQASQKLSSQAMSTQAVAYSDDQGVVRFTAYATSAPAQGTPVKFVVSATNDGGAALAEFKMFFINMSHLYYAPTLPPSRCLLGIGAISWPKLPLPA